MGIEKLGIDLPLLITQVINFAILFGLLWLVAYKPIMRMLDQRSQRVKESQEQAEEIKRKLAQTEEEVRAQLDTARKEGQGILNQAIQLGEGLKDEARQEARREAETMMARSRSDIERERGELVEQLRQEFADIAIEAAEKVIEQTLDRPAHQRIIEQVLEESTALRKEG